MLRTTVSRVKKVCSGALIPRILRGDPCGGPVSYAVVRKSFESTKSTDDGKQDTLASEEDNVEKKGEEAGKLEDKTTTNCSKPVVQPSIPLTHRERCQRIIDKAFGACEHTEANPELTQTYFSHNVNLEDTRRQIFESEKAKQKLQEQVKIQNPLLPESRTPFGIFKMPRELIKDDSHDEIELTKDSMFKVPPTAEGPKYADREDLVKTLNIHMTTAEEPDLTKNLDSVGTAEDNAPLLEPYSSNAKEDVEKCMNNPESVENKALRDDDAEAIEMVKDERKQYLYQKEIQQEQIDTLLPYNRTQFDVYSVIREDENQDEIILMDSTFKLPPVVGSQLAGREDLLTNAEENEKSVQNLYGVDKKKSCHDDNFQTINMDKDERKHMFINATTAKEDEEKLTQKLEIIEETPLVEAQIPKIEGFNVTPRVLGDQPVLNIKCTKNDDDYIPRMPVLPRGDLDDVAKRCLNSPLGRIDEILLNEMEKRPLKSIKTERNSPSKGILGDILVQMNEIKRRPNSKIEEQETHSESPKFEVEEEQPIGLTSPTRHITFEARLPDLNEDTEEITLINPKEDSLPTEETLQAIENTSPLKNKMLNKPHIVTEIHVLGIDSMEDAEKATTIVNTKATVSKEHKENDLSKDEQSAQCATYPTETTGTTPVERTSSKVKSLDSPNDASDNIIRYERLLKPEYVTHFRGVGNPSYCGTVNASNYAMDELQSKADKKSLCSRNLSSAYLWGQKHQNASASKTRYLQRERETDEIEQGQTSLGQFRKEEGVEHETILNRGFERVPYTNFRLPEHKWEKPVVHLPKVDKTTPLGSHEESYSKEDSQLKPGQEYVKVSVTDELLKEHELDPYYVLACNETCPIAPISTLSTYNHSDFVDTTETIYMKKNIFESIRPKPLPRDVKMVGEQMHSEIQALHELDLEFEPEVIPETGYIVTPEVNSTDTTEAFGNLPKLNEQVSLSELLRRVRQRSRLECVNDLKALGVSVEPTVGKCNRKAPRCPPTAPRSPPLNPVPPPSFGLPMLKRRPPVCKTPKKKPGCKCTACDMDVSCGLQIGEICPEMAYELNEAEVIALRSKTDLTEVIVDRLHNLGKVISGVLRQVKSSAETFFARDYDPWTPIPSWPSPQKGEKKKWQPGVPCNYRCPVFPKARASMNPEPPCDMKPCQGFPKRRSFSMLDCFAVSLDDVEVK